MISGSPGGGAGELGIASGGNSSLTIASTSERVRRWIREAWVIKYPQGAQRDPPRRKGASRSWRSDMLTSEKSSYSNAIAVARSLKTISLERSEPPPKEGKFTAPFEFYSPSPRRPRRPASATFRKPGFIIVTWKPRCINELFINSSVPRKMTRPTSILVEKPSPDIKGEKGEILLLITARDRVKGFEFEFQWRN